jgi:hypothetical protein
MHNTLQTAYLFKCEGEDLYAVSGDMTGRNIPRSSCTQGWRLCDTFELGRYAPVPAPILAEPILKGILQSGYYIWRGWSGPSERPSVPGP